MLNFKNTTDCYYLESNTSDAGDLAVPPRGSLASFSDPLSQ